MIDTYTKEELLEAIAKLDASSLDKVEVTHQPIKNLITVGTRGKDGKVQIFHVDETDYHVAMDMVRDEIIDVEKIKVPVVFACLLGTKEEVVPCEPIVPESA